MSTLLDGGDCNDNPSKLQRLDSTVVPDNTTRSVQIPPDNEKPTCSGQTCPSGSLSETSSLENESENTTKTIITTNYDIGNILTSGRGSLLSDGERCCRIIQDMSEEMKYKILLRHFHPDSKFHFPTSQQHGCNRRCKLDYLDNNFKYSPATDSVYCLPCALFVAPGDKRKSLNFFVNSGHCKWSNIKEKQKAHCATRYHQQAIFDADNLISRFEKPETTLPLRINKELQERHDTYGKVLLKIAQAVHFCGKQGIALRGHRESINPMDSDSNPGNFLALLKDYAKDDHVLYEHMMKPIARNASYHHQSQNEMIHMIGHSIIQADIIAEVKKSGFHTVMVDEVTSSNDEILSVCFRFVDEENNIREEFVEFINIHRITGEAIANAMLEFYKKVGLDIHQLRGQCYDGASNMSSEKKGVSGIISDHAPNAPYTHCSGHILNLCIAASCKANNIQHVIATMRGVAVFINYSPKREKLLEMITAKRHVHSANTRKVIVGLCKTRWSERDTAYEHFYLALPYLVECFDIISGTHPDMDEFDKEYTKGWDSQSKKDATAYAKAVTDFGFIVGLVSLYYLLHPLHGVTVYLQGRTIDIVKAYQLIDETVSDIKATRNNVEQEFKKIFEQAERIAEKLNVDPSLPRIAKRQVHRQNQPANTPEEYYRRTVAIPVLDCIIGEMETRFNKLSQRAVKLLLLVPTICCERSNICDNLKSTVDMYSNDLPNPDLVNTELKSWKRKWENEPVEDRPTSLATAIQSCDKTRFPNLYILLQIGCTLGVTSCECERSFSVMRRLRTWLRATMGTTRLSALALMNIHYGHTVDYKKVVELFLRLHPRRIQNANLIFQS